MKSIKLLTNSVNINVNVLLADDQLPMRELLHTILHSLCVSEMNIDAVGDGIQAVEQFRQTRHNIIFLDIDMPLLDGFSVLSQIIELDPSTFIVMVSGNSSIVNVKKSLELGAKGFIVKPYTSSKIFEMLTRYNDLSAKSD